jgi:hypothetical protein
MCWYYKIIVTKFINITPFTFYLPLYEIIYCYKHNEENGIGLQFWYKRRRTRFFPLEKTSVSDKNIH